MAWTPETSLYCSWKEVQMTGEKGRKEVRYYLKKRDGSADLAVVGREKSSRRMSYRHALKTSRSIAYTLKTREHVVDWLNSVVSDALPREAELQTPPSTTQDERRLNTDSLKDAQLQELVRNGKNFSWMGSSWTCGKRRKHYSSFCRNGVKVSVDDFVYVLAEEDKRLVAYLEDMYEDSKGSKMVVVRWFHKTDEVGIVLPHKFNDREIFCSLCLQDINIECIDGLATVLSLQHYEKFLEESLHVRPVVFFCRKLYEDDGLKPYDITQHKGYWRQEMLRYLNISISKSGEDAHEPGSSYPGRGALRLRKRRRPNPVEILDTPLSYDEKDHHRKDGPDYVNLDALAAPRKEADSSPSPYIKKGSLVEVLSQDSGIRGCWFRALIIKKHKDKVKVQYQDISDAEDESKKLEEWILASRISADDNFGLRIPGRNMIRPPLEACKGNTVWTVAVGMPVDVWWFDGWWEGIVVQRVSDERFEVFLPGEKKTSVFHRSDLRQSQEWLGDKWVPIEPRSDLVSSVLTSAEAKQSEVKFDEKPAKVGVGNGRTSPKGEAGRSGCLHVAATQKASVSRSVPDLLKDVLVSDLKWKASRKRKRNSSCCPQKLGLNGYCTKKRVVMKSRACKGLSLPSESFKVECENFKFMSDSLFGSSAVPSLTGLVMSR